LLGFSVGEPRGIRKRLNTWQMENAQRSSLVGSTRDLLDPKNQIGQRVASA